MSDSNLEWGHSGNNAAAPDRAPLYHEWAELQAFDPDPALVAPYLLEGFLAEKHLTMAAMNAVGCRWKVEGGKVVLGYLFPDAVKYRKLGDKGKRWTSPTGATWRSLKLVPCTGDVCKGVILAEGESDGAQLWQQYSDEWVIGILPAGALTFSRFMAEQVKEYEHVLVALDNDEAGNEGAARIMGMLRNAQRLRPPVGKDWCELAANLAARLDPFEWPDPLEASEERAAPPVYSLREVSTADLGTYEDNNWFDQDILPKTGSCIIHAPQKSLKSVIMLDMIRALATGTQFAGGYQFLGAAPARCLLFQMEIRPEGFQRRVQGWLDQMPPGERDLYLDNAFVYKIVDGELPRIKIGSDDFKGTILRAIEHADAQVVAFDPLQRLTGSADLNAANELEALLDFFAELQNQGLTVLSCHHNNKASGYAKGAWGMTGSQRFAADADSICSVWHSDECGPDENEDRVKRRNFTWTLRNGAAIGRSIEVRPAANSELMYVEFGPLLTLETHAVDDGAPPIL